MQPFKESGIFELVDPVLLVGQSVFTHPFKGVAACHEGDDVDFTRMSDGAIVNFEVEFIELASTWGIIRSSRFDV